MPQTVIIRGPEQRLYAKGLIDAAPDGAAVIVRERGETRTEAQNRTIHMWFWEVAKHQEDLDALEVKGMCHRHWGLNIKLRDEVFAWIWKRSGANLSYEKQCALLGSGRLNVSSSMEADELSEYMEAMSRHFRSQGINLTDPDLRKYEVPE
tara:strand:- start:16 stop:468 length:453 start_codon:yes stop_codon:yes gene_type:complete